MSVPFAKERPINTSKSYIARLAARRPKVWNRPPEGVEFGRKSVEFSDRLQFTQRPGTPYPGNMLAALKAWAARLKRDVVALWLAARDPRTPWHAKALAGFVAAYALSPIDLIPDFIPVLGWLDDLLIVPAGIWLALRLVPPALMAEFRERARAQARPRSPIAAIVIVALWLAAAGLLFWLWLRS
jgi:uncharacterized membrane protein YkvA (DUF1232 family)